MIEPMSELNCVVCSSNKIVEKYKNIKDLEYETYKPVNYFECKTCGIIFQNPLPSSDVFPTFYPYNYRNYLSSEKNVFSLLKDLQFKNLGQKLAKHFQPESKILEVGFGNGQLLLTLKELGYKNLFGTDFTDRVFPILRDKGIELQISNIEQAIPFDKSFDVIIMNNVIEHFADPVSVLKNCKKRLTDFGKVILITPNSQALELSIFRGFWAGFHAPRHTFVFSKKSIKMLTDRLGYSKIEIESMTDPGQISISIQNIFQNIKSTKSKLKNGMAWYLMPLTLGSTPLALLENITGRGTSMMCVIYNN